MKVFVTELCEFIEFYLSKKLLEKCHSVHDHD